MLEEIKSALQLSIQDNVLVGGEKKDIKELIRSANLDKRERDLLRSEIFKMAKKSASSNNFDFIFDWLEDANKLILPSEKGKSSIEKVYFSPGEHCLNAILNQIKLSLNKIEICLFTISDDRISEALAYKHKQGVVVKIITDNDKLYDKGSDIDKLAAAGIPIKVDVTDNHMHHKFALFDGNRTLTGSYNWTRSAERYNHENVLITESTGVMKAFKREFDDLWDELIRYDQV